jgi:hypothetical protein
MEEAILRIMLTYATKIQLATNYRSGYFYYSNKNIKTLVHDVDKDDSVNFKTLLTSKNKIWIYN